MTVSSTKLKNDHIQHKNKMTIHIQHKITKLPYPAQKQNNHIQHKITKEPYRAQNYHTQHKTK